MYKQVQDWLLRMEKTDKSETKITAFMKMAVRYASWQEVYDFWSKLTRPALDDASNDAKMYRMMQNRLLTPEWPVLGKQFIFDNLGEFVQVPNNATPAQIKDAVKEHFIGTPMYVLEKSRRFRGVALTSDLVLAGISSAYAPAKVVQDKVDELDLKLLTKEESRTANKALPQLDYMLQAAGVPCLSHCFGWLVSGNDGKYKAYSLNRLDYGWRCHPDESIYLVVKY